ncbi:hypothetical protein NPIL_220591 [Nephila pilipes]|uniref:Uncharacterized protein n=1 Tax=Nephila pilipes TaxID=299642 RepID=A0A8X6QQ24_NEPPI|nr:hypothetical protein NPIL_220591 [Nephila pilipes]
MKQTPKNIPTSLSSRIDVIEIYAPKEDAMKAKKRLLEISNEKQLVGHSIEIKTNPEQHKFLIGKNLASVKKKYLTRQEQDFSPVEKNDDKNIISVYDGTRAGCHEGLNCTTSCAEYPKLWSMMLDL